MAEKTKSATTAPKPRKTAAKKKAADTPSNVTEITVVREKVTVSREAIAQLAHQLWNERGRQHGKDAEDWLRAEELLRGKAS